MDVTAAINKRCTIRKWDPMPVEKEKIVKVLEAGRRAPSWGNTQPWRFIVVQDKAKIEEIAAAAGGQAQAKAPVVIVCCGATDSFTFKQHGDALKELRDAGVMDATDDFLDNVLLKSDVFAPYLLGNQAMMIRASEQIMIAMAFMTLEAVNQGLGTCWLGAISPKLVHKAMNLPDSLFVHALLALGYAGENPKPRPRKAADKIIFWEKYG